MLLSSVLQFVETEAAASARDENRRPRKGERELVTEDYEAAGNAEREDIQTDCDAHPARSVCKSKYG